MIQVNLEASNKEDWTIQVSATDADTGEDIDFTGASIAFRLRDDCSSVCIDASTDDGSITIPSSSLVEIAITDDQMGTLCAGTYKVGCIYEINGTTAQLFVGKADIYDGIASL